MINPVEVVQKARCQVAHLVHLIHEQLSLLKKSIWILRAFQLTHITSSSTMSHFMMTILPAHGFNYSNANQIPKEPLGDSLPWLKHSMVWLLNLLWLTKEENLMMLGS